MKLPQDNLFLDDLIEFSRDEELKDLGVRYSITTSNENRKNSAANSDGMTGQPISSLQRAIRNTIIGGVKSSISRQSDSDHDQAVSD